MKMKTKMKEGNYDFYPWPPLNDVRARRRERKRRRGMERVRPGTPGSAPCRAIWGGPPRMSRRTPAGSSSAASHLCAPVSRWSGPRPFPALQAAHQRLLFQSLPRNLHKLLLPRAYGRYTSQKKHEEDDEIKSKKNRITTSRADQKINIDLRIPAASIHHKLVPATSGGRLTRSPPPIHPITSRFRDRGGDCSQTGSNKPGEIGSERRRSLGRRKGTKRSLQREPEKAWWSFSASSAGEGTAAGTESVDIAAEMRAKNDPLERSRSRASRRRLGFATLPIGEREDKAQPLQIRRRSPPFSGGNTSSKGVNVPPMAKEIGDALFVHRVPFVSFTSHGS